jgi:probable phosphoglycerate mutase
MRIIFIRNAEPDYSIDSLTEKGVAEAMALNKRILTWDNEFDYFCSPLGQAELTGEIAMSDTGKEAETLQWLKEFDVSVKDPSGSRRNPWDFMPSYWTADEKLLSYDKWAEADIMQTGDVAKEYAKSVKGLDSLLKKYGYVRDGKIYRVNKHSDKTVVLFSHIGTSFMLMGHLLNISPVSLIQGMCMLPCSLSVLQTEEREPGIAAFRASIIGDVSHLRTTGEPLSEMGYFAKVFQQ